MNIKEQLNSAKLAAMKSGDSVRLNTVRDLLTRISNVEHEGKERSLDDGEVLTVLRKAATSRQQSIDDAMRANRTDIADKERHELGIIEEFLPKLMTEDQIGVEVATLVNVYKGTVNRPLQGSDMGRIIGEFNKQFKGRADGKLVAEVVKRSITG